MDTKTKQKLEALIRADIESMSHKYRDLRDMFYYGTGSYKDMSKEEIDGLFEEMELEITEQDKEWATYN